MIPLILSCESCPAQAGLGKSCLFPDSLSSYSETRTVDERLPAPAARTAREDPAAAVEAERRRLAGLLQDRVIEPLNLLLAQANAYEQGLGANPQARLAVSVLTSLARQTLQQARDLEANLHPAILETLGLEPALESLVSQVTRAHGLQVTLAVERLPDRLPAPVELALFRVTQDVLDRAVRHARASQVTIRLARRDKGLTLRLTDNGVGSPPPAGEPLAALREAAHGQGGGDLFPLRAACQRVEELGGLVEMGAGPHGGLALEICLDLAPPAQLTPREMEVLQLLAQGLSNRAIAQRLVISPRTVNFHLDNVYAKLGVHSRTEAAIYALHRGWVPGPG